MTRTKSNCQYYQAHLLRAIEARGASPVRVGCQGVYRTDVAAGGNFGALTTNRPAAAMMEMAARMS